MFKNKTDDFFGILPTPIKYYSVPMTWEFDPLIDGCSVWPDAPLGESASDWMKNIFETNFSLLDESIVFGRTGLFGAEIRKLPKSISEINEPVSTTLKSWNSGNLNKELTYYTDLNMFGDNKKLAILWLTPSIIGDNNNSHGIKFENVFKQITNMKVPYTIDELKNLSEIDSDIVGTAFNYYGENNYTGTFEFSDGVKKTLSELAELFS